MEIKWKKLNNLLKGRQLSFMWKIKCKKKSITIFSLSPFALRVAQTKSLTFVIAIAFLSLSACLCHTVFLYLFELITQVPAPMQLGDHAAAYSAFKFGSATKHKWVLCKLQCRCSKGPAKGDFPLLFIVFLMLQGKLMENTVDAPVFEEAVS